MSEITIKCPLCGDAIPLALTLVGVRMTSTGVVVEWGPSEARHVCRLLPLEPDPSRDAPPQRERSWIKQGEA